VCGNASWTTAASVSTDPATNSVLTIRLAVFFTSKSRRVNCHPPVPVPGDDGLYCIVTMEFTPKYPDPKSTYSLKFVGGDWLRGFVHVRRAPFGQEVRPGLGTVQTCGAPPTRRTRTARCGATEHSMAACGVGLLTSGTAMQPAAAAFRTAGAASVTGLCVARWLSCDWSTHVPLLQLVTSSAFDPFCYIAVIRDRIPGLTES
jgi:hypothetical protein